ncbi:helix-turn-helix domain-containing protein [Saccharothrix obliqua]|uniref:helix-turn-helix domain-containing protein n=1 Tax=Saccharothrix obliqua TaxID=2861747 RepID=UPI001C5E060D|nr:helix-turn-helix transcriptional regulator [Saccharothrix obliqua]MBW4717556.1 helix-turn-helix transcriptional regulator [Saccharothrix obliqua]
MTPGSNPLADRRRLRTELRQKRDALGMTQKDVVEALEWSPSKLIRIEKGSVGISITDLKALLLHYGVTDGETVDRLVRLARNAKSSAWWNEYRSVSPRFQKFVAFESSAIRIRQYQGLVFPGLLQDRAYVEALMHESHTEHGQRMVGARLKRQEIITDDGPELRFILDESVLHREVGDHAVMRAQLEHVKELAAHPNVSVRLIPFSAGVHKGMTASFAIFELSDERDDHAVLLEGPYEDVLYEDPSDETAKYVDTFAELEEIALSPEETSVAFDRRLRRLGEED